MRFLLSFMLFFIGQILPTYATQWRSLDPNNTVLMTLPHGKVVIELAPQFSPKHVEQFKKLTKQGLFDNNKFYRVIDGFVAQAGPEARRDNAPLLNIESEWQPTQNWPFTLVQQNDLFAPQTGFVDGFAVGYDPKANQAWLNHCPGILAMARGNNPNSATSHFYFTIGQAPRYLDRIMTIFGRVVYGMNHIQAIQRTAVVEGDKPIAKEAFTPIVSMQLMKDVPETEQIIIEVEQTASNDFKAKLKKRLARRSSFFYKKPPQVLDICQVPILSRRVK
jgi:peptidylprolyl isomerase